MLKGKKILLGITGGIAAYKTPALVRELIRNGAEVQVVITPSAKSFVTEQTLSVVSGKPVLSEWFSEADGTWNNHVDLGINPDLLVIAPATANSLAAFRSGLCQNLLQGIFLSARCPVMMSPAMDHDMYHHPATQENIEVLTNRGVTIIPPETGELASGIFGDGRMPEPLSIVETIQNFFTPSQSLTGKRVLITSGPTNEAIDEVRFIGNHSSGKMGAALALEASARGAEVVVVSGPAKVVPAGKNIRVEKVTSASEMFEKTQKEFPDADLVIFAAAVADFTPEIKAKGKIKKETTNSLDIHLVPTKDIAGTLSPTKKSGQITVGFALETDNEEQNALGKLKRKNLDFIVLNSLRDPGAGFDTDTNQVRIYSNNNNVWSSGLSAKSDIARAIFDQILNARNVEV